MAHMRPMGFGDPNGNGNIGPGDAMQHLIRNSVKEEIRGMVATMTPLTPRPSTTMATTTSFNYDQLVASPHEEEEGSSAVDWVMVIGGLMVFLYIMNRAIGYVYFRAVSYIDLGNRHQEFNNNWRRSFWRIVETVLRHAWIPLWFTHTEIFHDAVRANLDQEFQRLRLQNMIDQGNPIPMVRFRNMLQGNFIDFNRNDRNERDIREQQGQQGQQGQLGRPVRGQHQVRFHNDWLPNRSVNDDKENRADKNKMAEVDLTEDGYEQPRRAYEQGPVPVRRLAVRNPDLPEGLVKSYLSDIFDLS